MCFQFLAVEGSVFFHHRRFPLLHCVSKWKSLLLHGGIKNFDAYGVASNVGGRKKIVSYAVLSNVAG